MGTERKTKARSRTGSKSSISENSRVLAFDPGSNLSGVALFDGTGKILACQTLYGGAGHWSQRFQQIVAELDAFLKESGISTVHEIVTEMIPPLAHPGLRTVVGAILTLPQLSQTDLKKENFISPSSWKAFARKNGCTEKDPKGIAALSSLLKQQPFPESPTDDAADAILIGLTWFASKKLAS